MPFLRADVLVTAAESQPGLSCCVALDKLFVVCCRFRLNCIAVHPGKALLQHTTIMSGFSTLFAC